MNYFEAAPYLFYTTQSGLSNPGSYRYLFDSLPSDLYLIKEILQGLLLHFLESAAFPEIIPPSRLSELDLRYVESMLQKIIFLDQRALSIAREMPRKLISSCRDFSLLACSILRHHGIAARLRVVFNAYYNPLIFHDQLILEYWHARHCAWFSVDVRMTELHLRKSNIDLDFDLFNLPEDKYIPAAFAWISARKKPELAHKFGGGVGHRGLWYLRDRLLQDLAAVNKVEMLIWDCWGMMNTPKDEISEEDLIFLDQVALMLLAPDCYFLQLIDLYNNNSLVKVPQKIVSFTPVGAKKTVDLCI
jgi:hypothetical protein